jgi:hypothetical protein
VPVAIGNAVDGSADAPATRVGAPDGDSSDVGKPGPESDGLAGTLTSPSTPPAGRNLPPMVMARTTATTINAPAAIDRRRSNRRRIEAVRLLGVIRAAVTPVYGKAQAGQAPAASAQHQRHAYRLHDEQ